MKIAALILIAATLSACAGYQPSEVNCFGFIASEEGCDFTPLSGPRDG